MISPPGLFISCSGAFRSYYEMLFLCSIITFQSQVFLLQHGQELSAQRNGHLNIYSLVCRGRLSGDVMSGIVCPVRKFPAVTQ